MLKSFEVGSVFNIPIKLDITFLLILPVFAWIIGARIDRLVVLLNSSINAGINVGFISGGILPFVLGFAIAIGLFISVILHELGHSFIAIRSGIPIESITLWIFGGVAQLTDQPERWEDELSIAVAGPIVSIALGTMFYTVLVLLPLGLDIVRFFFGYLGLINIVLAVFNLLPGFPMDGGRVLRALLARNRSFTQATQIAAEVGKVFAFILGLIGIFRLNILLIGIAFFIYIGASSEAQQTIMRTAFEGVKVKDVMTPKEKLDTVDPEINVEQLLEHMFEQRHTGYPVIKDNEIQGIVTLDDASDIKQIEREVYTVSDIMTKDLKTVDSEMDAMEAFNTLQKSDIGRLVVTDKNQNLKGLISRTDIMKALKIIKETGPIQTE